MNHIAPPPEPLIREIPLSCLALAPENVRKTPANEYAETELIASIKAHGLLENLVARADDSAEDGADRFAVVAGGRRLAALKAFAEDGTLDADHPVPCKIAANGNAGELSLAENVVRIAMHPADQVVAFFNLARSGATVAAIAARFGVTERLVEQRLRLGNAAPDLLDAYREDAIDLETLKAFSVTTDHDRQRAVWEQVSRQGWREQPVQQRPEAIRIGLVVTPQEGPRRILDLDADLAFAGEAWCWAADALPLVTPDSDLEPWQLAQLTRAGFFSASDDTDADSWETQRTVFETEALHAATKLLVSDDEARRTSIADAVARDLFWLIPHDRGAESSVRDRKVTVTLGEPVAEAVAGG